MSKSSYISYKECHKIENNVEYKMCKKCKDWFELNEINFKVQPSQKDGFSHKCRKCQEEYNHNRYINNREKEIEASKKWRAEHPEKVEEYWKRQNDKKDPSRILYKRQAAKLSRERGHVKRWCEEHPESVKFYSEKRQHKNHKINPSEWIACKEYFKDEDDDYCCAYCGLKIQEHYRTYAGKIQFTDLHKEHVDHEGLDDLSNCVPSCLDCNSHKWEFPLEMWYNSDNPIYTEERYSKVIKWITEDYKAYQEIYIPKRQYKNRKSA